MGLCFPTPGWKREEIPDHKLDFINVDEFTDKSCGVRLAYSSVFLLTLKSVFVYIADMWTLILLFTSPFDDGAAVEGSNESGTCAEINAYGSTTTNPDQADTQFKSSLPVPIEYRKWIVLASIMLSFGLLLWDFQKAHRIIKSRDISFTITSSIAYRYYALRSYPHYCFFRRVMNTSKQINNLAMFIFFTLRGWKRLFFAESPRRIFMLFLLIDLIRSYRPDSVGEVFQILATQADCGDFVRLGVFVLMVFTLLVWSFNVVFTTMALLVYIPLFCEIQGNLKEYCCHLIDKRISEILRKQAVRRVVKTRPEGDDVDRAALSKLRGIVLNTTEPSSAPTMSVDTNNYTAKDAPYTLQGIHVTSEAVSPMMQTYYPDYPLPPVPAYAYGDNSSPETLHHESSMHYHDYSYYAELHEQHTLTHNVYRHDENGVPESHFQPPTTIPIIPPKDEKRRNRHSPATTTHTTTIATTIGASQESQTFTSEAHSTSLIQPMVPLTTSAGGHLIHQTSSMTITTAATENIEEREVDEQRTLTENMIVEENVIVGGVDVDQNREQLPPNDAMDNEQPTEKDEQS